MQRIKAKDVLVYTTMPRIVPRVKGLFSSGFSFVAFLMAHIYYMVRLLPQYHPYLASENIGRFGISHVMTEASRSLTFSKKNIDQLVVYFAMLMGIVLIIAQFILFVYALAISPAMAFSWFDTVNPQTDIAYSLLDRVFGIPNLFCSFGGVCTDYSFDPNEDGAAGPPLPLPFHVGLHGLFRFYSTGLLLIAMLIFLYFVVVIILETATSGTPFGQRFQNVWVPVRLIVALGLLMPINFGISSGQYIVLYAAKYGSSFATNGWREFNDTIQTHSVFTGATPSNPNPIGERYSLVAIPEAPDVTPMLQAMSVVHACAYAYHRLVAGNANTTSGTGSYSDVYADYTRDTNADGGDYRISPYFVKTRISSMTTAEIGVGSGVFGLPDERLHIPDRTSVTYMDALGFYYASDIVIRFGEFKRDSAGGAFYDEDTGNVKPLCGDVRIPVNDLSDPGGATASPSRGGSSQMLRHYYDVVLALWFTTPELRQFGRAYVEHSVEQKGGILRRICSGASESTGAGAPLYSSFPGFQSTPADCIAKPPTARWKQDIIAFEISVLAAEIQDAWSNYVLNATYGGLSVETLDRGWGGAGIWYNKIAEINGMWMDGARGVPYLENSPSIIKEITEAKQQSNEGSDPNDCEFTLKGEENSAPQVKQPGGDLEDAEKIGPPICKVSKFWSDNFEGYQSVNRPDGGNPFIDAMNLLLGMNGLVSMRGANMHLHPMAQLVAVGKGLVDSAIIGMAGSTASAFLGGMFGALGEKTKGLGKFAEAASSIFFSIAFMGLTVGFILFYVLPFLPFIYFYFAVASWVKAIFEAMVGVPLWALAHLRIDGEGLPGDAAQNGYFLILEIFVRPILTVFGLLAAIVIFSTQVRILNLIWDLVTANAAGFESRPDILGMGHAQDLVFKRSVVDKFFFTIIYTIVCYMLALSSFKLIDKIPDNILRWAGAGVSSFGDIDQDQVDSINRYAAMGGMTVGQQAAGALNTAAGGLGRVAGTEMAKLNQPAKGTAGAATGAGTAAGTPGATTKG